jgi:hypothetical protein
VAFLRIDNHRTDPSGLPMGKGNLGGGRHMFLSFSDDEGRTWAEPWPCYLPTGRWNGSMTHALLVGDFVYLVGNPSYHGPAHLGAYFTHVQRCPLVLTRFPLAELEGLESGAPTPMCDAARVVETSVTGRIARREGFFRRYDIGCPSTPHLILLRNGHMGLLYDTNLGPGTPMRLKFKEIAPSWIESGRLDLWRGPRPEPVLDGFRVTDTQTEVRPVRFAFGGFPVEISFDVRVGDVAPGDDFWRLVSVFGHGEWVSAPGYSPFSELGAVGVEPGRPRVLVAATGDGFADESESAELADTGLRLEPGRGYAMRLVFVSRRRWELHVDGRKVGEYSTQFPGIPKSFTLGHHPAKSATVDFTFTHVSWSGSPRRGPMGDEHPWIAEAFDPRDVRGRDWPGRYGGLVARLHGEPRRTEKGLSFDEPGQWAECDASFFAGRRLAFFGGFAAFVKVRDEAPVDLFGVEDSAAKRYVRLRAEGGRLVLAARTGRLDSERLLELAGLPAGRWCFVGYASGALHRAGWLVIDDCVSPRWHPLAPREAPVFFGQAFSAESRAAHMRAGFRLGQSAGRPESGVELGRVWLIGRDCQPSTLLRLRESACSQYE